MNDKLTDNERAEALAALLKNGWAMVEGRDAIVKKFRFKNFIAAFGWMTKAAILAEKQDHHPEWSNVYNRVEVTLTSHNINGLSQRDLVLAQAMDAL